MYTVPPALSPAVYIPGLVFEALIRARNGLYAAALLPRRRLPGPVISVGNITMGGTGKTPLVIYIAQVLLNLGYQPAILTRGYGRNRPGESHILAPGEEVPSPALTLGDEPALIRRRIPSTWMGVSKDRFLTGSILSKRASRMVFVLDDGFQHRKLHRNLDIVILDSSRPLESDRVFPRGTLREPISALRRCNVLVVNGPLDSAEAGSIEAEIRRLQARAKIFRCHQGIQSLTPFPSWQTMAFRTAEGVSGCHYPGIQVAAWKPANFPSAYLAGALGNPERFRRDIQRIGFAVLGATFFADHHRLSRKDWQYCIEQARRKGAGTVIITEKDAVKIREAPDFPLLVAEQTTEMAEASAFALAVKKCIEERQ